MTDDYTKNKPDADSSEALLGYHFPPKMGLSLSYKMLV
jgi:hypothetical protein